MKVLVTGAAGFIGYHVSKKLIGLGHSVFGIDSYNDYYDPELKKARAAELPIDVEYVDLCQPWRLDIAFAVHKPDAVIHLAAYAGVRSSLEDPQLYIQNNIISRNFSNNRRSSHRIIFRIRFRYAFILNIMPIRKKCTINN